ncbi:MAG: nitrate reductase molybdenum cofactor assembly chaperone [Propionibacteriaceae bacterium]|nr:nitrate reductase molybdenum cofactor assembly chaperone [Propionibacteriaceae bacterium]
MTVLLEAEPTRFTVQEPDVPGYKDALALASVMLGYPDDSLCLQRASICQAVDQLPASSVATSLRTFAHWWVDADPFQMRQDYVTTFDTRRGAALYVTYLDHGDNGTRGVALYDIKHLYRANGFQPSDEELPDYLPTVCQFVALAPLEGALNALVMAREAVIGIHRNLARARSPYAPILAAIETIIEKGVQPCGS